MTQSGCFSTLKDLFNSLIEVHWYETILPRPKQTYISSISRLCPALQQQHYKHYSSLLDVAVFTTSSLHPIELLDLGETLVSHPRNAVITKIPLKMKAAAGEHVKKKTTTFDFPLRLALKCDESQRLLWARSQMGLAESTSLFCWLPSLSSIHSTGCKL